MDSKKRSLLIIMLILVVIIITVIILLIQVLSKDKNIAYNTENVTNISNQEDITSKDNEIINTEIYKVRDCVSIYLSAINMANPIYYGKDANGNLVKTISNETINENIYPLLSQNYIKENNITIDNLNNYIDNIDKNVIFDVLNIKRYINNNSYQYITYGILTDIENNFIKFAYYNVYINFTNNLFAIEPILKSVSNIAEIEKKDVIIKKNNYNDIPINNLTQEGIIKEVLNTYKRLMLAKPDLAYEYLDDSYKEKKFGNVDNFINYINKNKKQLVQLRLNQYSYNDYNDYIQLICVDQNGHYYIFNEEYPMQYTVILDTYTIDLPEFVEQYNSSSEDKKVQFNIQKFFDAINDGDYSYAYSKLDQTYKNNNFPTQTDFENYMKTNFYAQNKLGYTSYEKNGDLYIYKMVITNGENSSQTIEKQFVVKLLDGTNFVMSFEK